MGREVRVKYDKVHGWVALLPWCGVRAWCLRAASSLSSLVPVCTSYHTDLASSQAGTAGRGYRDARALGARGCAAARLRLRLRAAPAPPRLPRFAVFTWPVRVVCRCATIRARLQP
jgi:hypothetical protein